MTFFIARLKDWLLNPKLAGKKVKLVVKGTKILPTFQGGQYEGCVASFIALHGRDMVQVRMLPKCSTASIPWKFLEPFPPSAVGEKVVCICGEEVGSEYVLCKISDDEFSLAHLLAPKVAVVTLPKRFLAVLSRV